MVIAGQQPGLFLSPLYILYKAVAAVKWARVLRESLGRPGAPAFWVASDDHDFEEIRHVRYLNRDGHAARWTYSPKDCEGQGGKSLFEIPAEDGALASFPEALESSLHDTEFKPALLERWRGTIAASENLEDFFARGMTDLLGSEGLVLVSPRLAPIRRRAAGIIEREIARPRESAGLVRAVAERWAEEGRTPPLHRRGNEANFFLYREGLRCKVTAEGGVFQIRRPSDGEILETAGSRDLLEELARTPEAFSPNVITRPVVQNSALPILAMVGGPGEARYLAQLEEAKVSDFFNAFPAPHLPRPRALLVEPRIERLLKKYGVDGGDLAAEDWETVEKSVVRRGGFGSALDGLEAFRPSGAAALDALAERLGPLAQRSAVASALEKTSKNWTKTVEKLEQRVLKEIESEGKTLGDHLHKILEALRPEHKPQERVLGPLAPFLVNFGPDFVPWLLEALDIEREDVQVLYLSAMGIRGEAENGDWIARNESVRE